MSAGMAYEAMNNAEAAGNRLIVILNDNDMSIAPPVGGLSAYLARIVSSREFLSVRDILRRLARKLPNRCMSPHAKQRNSPAAWRRVAPCSKNWAFIMSVRWTVIISIT